MKKFRNLKIYIILLIILAGAVLLILNQFLVYGLILTGIAILFFGLWSVFIKSKEEEITKLASRLEKMEKQYNALEAENDELRNRKLNIAEIRSKVDLGLMEINTNFTRTWNDQFSHKNKTVHFIGALKVKIVARYGVDLKDLMVKHNKETNTLTIANINPRFLSFNDLDYEWRIAEILEYKKQWIGTNHWRKSTLLQELATQIKEDLRLKTHNEVKNGAEELDWVISPLKKQIAGILELIFSAPGWTIKIADSYDESFKALSEQSFDYE